VSGGRRGRKSKFSRTASFCNANDTNDFATLLVFVIYQVVLPWTDAGFFSTRTPHFRTIRWRNYAFLWPTMRSDTHFYPGSMRSVKH